MGTYGENHRKYIGYYRKSHEKWRDFSWDNYNFLCFNSTFNGKSDEKYGKR